jgi:hypothetical protein
MGNSIVHFEIFGDDYKGLGEFYASQFGWQLQPAGEGYDLITTADGSIGGGIGTPYEGRERQVIVYVQVPSIDKALASIEAAGGKTILPKTEIPELVIYAQFADPAGNVVGLVEGE